MRAQAHGTKDLAYRSRAAPANRRASDDEPAAGRLRANAKANCSPSVHQRVGRTFTEGDVRRSSLTACTAHRAIASQGAVRPSSP
ncbi:hypothetical protein GCM10022288_19710 [Gryllotalpicola kribbensis]|uniref:Uncharacterized protein n=1 Tax=Gryllotalpicola kribbensis TaxID=993084 RepID=A0ABP8AUH1_9MICO